MPPGGVTVTPIGQLFQQSSILARRGERDVQLFELCPRIGQSHALVQTCLGRPLVGSGQAQGIGNLVDHNEELAGLSPLRIFAFEAVGGQVWKPQCQKPVRSV